MSVTRIQRGCKVRRRIQSLGGRYRENTSGIPGNAEENSESKLDSASVRIGPITVWAAPLGFPPPSRARAYGPHPSSQDNIFALCSPVMIELQIASGVCHNKLTAVGPEDNIRRTSLCQTGHVIWALLLRLHPHRP